MTWIDEFRNRSQQYKSCYDWLTLNVTYLHIQCIQHCDLFPLISLVSGLYLKAIQSILNACNTIIYS